MQLQYALGSALIIHLITQMSHRRHIDQQRDGDLQLLRDHCDMLLLSFGRVGDLFAAPQPQNREALIAGLLDAFSLLHLLTTLYLVDSNGHVTGGIATHILRQRSQHGLLRDIHSIMGRDVGRTSVGDFLRRARNKLAVHGDLTYGRLAPEIREVLESPQLLATLNAELAKLPAATIALRDAL